MLTIGVDAHKRVRAAVAVDDGEREVGQWRGPNSADGWRDLAAWAEGLGAPSRRGIEGARGYGRWLAQALVADGGEVYGINPRRTAAGRWRARRTDKAVPDLLVTERTDLVAGSTHLRNRLHHPLPVRSRIRRPDAEPANAGRAARVGTPRR